MEYLNNYQLILFDFDGLLVNTEEIHYAAYRLMLQKHGITFDWSFHKYCLSAHYEATALHDNIYQEYPELHAIESSWDVLYAEKKRAYMDLVTSGTVALMPGVENLLTTLQDLPAKTCVVTHSAYEQIVAIREQNPILNTIDDWITREDYSIPKPHPECYQTAIAKHASDTDAIIGFEDSPRGLRALMKSRATSVLVCDVNYPEIDSFIGQGAHHYRDFNQFAKENSPS